MRKISCFLTACFFAHCLQAQTTIGLKVGPNLSNMNASANGVSVSLNMKTGFHGGLFFTIPSGKAFSVQPEIVYSQEGADYKQTGSSIRLNCINVPVMFQYNASGLIVEAGPQIGFLLSAKENGYDATNEYENLHVALGLGLAYRLKEGVGFGARYNTSVTSIVKAAGQDVSVKSSVWQLGLTFSLARIKK